MTTLERITLDKGSTYLAVYEAPYNLTTSLEKQNWIKREKPCFNKKIFQFWELYNTKLQGERSVILPYEAEEEERRRFIRYPITTLETKRKCKIKTIGGIWIDNVTTNKSKEKTVHIHIKVSDRKRNLAYPLLDKFIKSITNQYNYIYTNWDNRKPQNDPANFLKNNGFKITKNAWGNKAILKL
jgi:hypothetical protein